MSQLGLDVYLKCLQKYGLPFVQLEVDTAQVDTVNNIVDTFQNLSSVLNVIAVNKGAVVKLMEMNYNGAAEAHDKFHNHIKDLIDTLVLGQTLSSDAKSTGLGSGVASLHSDVREDYINYDRQTLNESLRTNLFRQLLDINGYLDGQAPNIVWGSGISTEDVVQLTTAIKNLGDCGYTLTEDSISDLSSKFGFTFQTPSDLPATAVTKKETVTKDGNEATQGPAPTADEVMKKKVIQAKLGRSAHDNI
jgi:phage gp29-like protein